MMNRRDFIKALGALPFVGRAMAESLKESFEPGQSDDNAPCQVDSLSDAEEFAPASITSIWCPDPRNPGMFVKVGAHTSGSDGAWYSYQSGVNWTND